MKEHQLQNVAFLLQNLLKSFGKYFPSECLDLAGMTIEQSIYINQFNAKLKNEFIDCKIGFCFDKDEFIEIKNINIENHKTSIKIRYYIDELGVIFPQKQDNFIFDFQHIEVENYTTLCDTIKEIIAIVDKVSSAKTFEEIKQVLYSSCFVLMSEYCFETNFYDIKLISRAE